MVRCPKCGEQNPPKFKHCGYCGASIVEQALPSQELRKTLTIVFTDLKGSTALGEQLDAETLHEVKKRYFDAMAAEISRHGGKIEKYIGDAIMAVFGLPQTHEDDALRAVRAVVDMRAALLRINHDLLARHGVALATRTGVNTGEVVTSADPSADQNFSTGDAVNVAARLEQAACEGEILIGASTYELVRGAVEVEPVGPLALKGKAGKVAAFRLLAAHGVDGYARREDSPIVGREDELAAIDKVLVAVHRERIARLVIIVGDAGIGKSRLAREVILGASTAGRVVRGRCMAYGEGITFLPLRDIAFTAADIRSDENPVEACAKLEELINDDEVTVRLASAIGLSEEAYALHEVNWAARKLFERLATEGPLVALIDDIHWAEPAFLSLLEHVLAFAENAPILLLATARPDFLDRHPQWGERPAALRLELKPLSDGAAVRVAENLLGTTSFSLEITDRVVTAAEGNPLYVEQILAMLIDKRAIHKRGDGQWVPGVSYGEIGIPPTIRALLEARLGQLKPNERSAIEPASVIGMHFAARAVTCLASGHIRTSIDEQLAALLHKRFIEVASIEDEDRIYSFQHHLVRDTVYNALLKRVRVQMHVEYVRWSDRVNEERGSGLEYEEMLGYHLEQAYRYLAELGPLDEVAREIGRDASRRLASAGRRAFARGDVHAADKLFRRALELLDDDDPLRMPLFPQRAEVLLELGKLDEAQELADYVRTPAETVLNVRVRAAAELVEMHIRHYRAEPGSWLQAIMQLTTTTIPLLEKLGAHAELARAWRLVALGRQVAGSLGSAGDAIAEVLTHARAAGDERFVMRTALGMTFNALYGPMPVQQALERCEQFVIGETRDRLVQGVIKCKLAQLRSMKGEFALARMEYRQARTMLDDLGQTINIAATSFDLAMIELRAGDPAAAEEAIKADYSTLVKMGATYLHSAMDAILARAVREQGRDEEAFELTGTVEASAADDDVDDQVLWRSIRAPILARLGRLTEAEALARVACEKASRTDLLTLHAYALGELASVLQLAGRNDEARITMGEAVAQYEKKGDVPFAAWAKRQLEAMERGVQ